MGVKKINDLFEGTPIELDELNRKHIAVDAYNVIYQFLASIRGMDGSLLTDEEGSVTSHLSGLLARNARLLEKGLSPIYVFDGIPSVLKKEEITKRKERKEQAKEDYEKALEEGDLVTARIKAQQTSTLTKSMVSDSKKLLTLMGIPIIEAPQEGEAQAAYMAQKGDVWAVASQDFDSILFGAPILIRNLTLSGRRKLPRSNRYITIAIEQYNSEELLSTLGLTKEQLVDLAILIGTDFNPDGIKGVGPKTAYKYITTHGSLEEVLAKESIALDVDYKEIRTIFLNPSITPDYQIKNEKMDVQGILNYLCDEKGFNKERVENILTKAKKGYENTVKQKSLDTFFK